ncbi:SDR family oxidoreductase [Virgisporangium aurantiacum]|uniref:LysR family transcriptional regulator n=1 Tax=Virgisporangium aurantiacum TaxID=175570 RepID=A0A8J3Z3X2_9ACTN|nr:SDR family oxidoreductase [Virgisporangium aurantiacum]GIJ55927.1 LysR family transcriptional regulator [Virgisporangium aurantiacum]
MKIVVIGGSGLIGSKLVGLLTAAGHEAVPASPRTGVDTVTGEGLADVLASTNVVVDVTNPPSFDTVLEFFRASTANLLAAGRAAGVAHHLVLSVVGAERVPDSSYLPAKVAQEELVAAGGVPYTILRATQFFEFAAGIADVSTAGDGTVVLPPALVQPVAGDDVAAVLADLVTDAPVNGTVELGGPESLPLADWVRRSLAATGDPRTVVSDPAATYFGAKVDDDALRPGAGARTGTIRLTEWLSG